jgi:hypothetical protein
MALSLRLAPAFPKHSFLLDANSPFASFLQFSAQLATLHDFAVLVGNPNSPGNRFVFLLFNADNTPACIVKAGTTPVARRLVRRETTFLQQYSRQFPYLPVPLGESAAEDYTALVLPFIAGTSPRLKDHGEAPKLLGSWISDQERIPLRSIPAWQNLPQNNDAFRKVPPLLADQMLTPVLMHGDFAPWNIKVAKDGTWTSLDWERGEFPGIPGWDWFHYVVQTSILVRRDLTARTLQSLELLLASSHFQNYAQQTGILGFEKPLLTAYLIHAQQLRQTEGTDKLDQLLAALC